MHSLKHLPQSLIHFLENHYTVGMALADLLTSYGFFASSGLYPRIVRLPEGHRIYLSDTQTIFCTIPELYIDNEYELHPDYQPRRGWTVLDAGANVGLYTLRASGLVEELGLVVSFEPHPVSRYWLNENLGLNRVRNVRVYPVALGNSEGYADFQAGTGRNVRLSTLIDEHMVASAKYSGDSRVYSIRVPVTKLESFMQKELPDRVVDLMKVDVEGAEMDVFRGAIGLFDRSLIQRIVVEVHLGVIQEADLTQLLTDHGFRIDRIVRTTVAKEMLYARAIT